MNEQDRLAMEQDQFIPEMKRRDLLTAIEDESLLYYGRSDEVLPVRVYGLRIIDDPRGEGFQVLYRALNPEDVPTDEGWVHEKEWTHEGWIHLTQAEAEKTASED